MKGTPTQMNWSALSCLKVLYTFESPSAILTVL